MRFSPESALAVHVYAQYIYIYRLGDCSCLTWERASSQYTDENSNNNDELNNRHINTLITHTHTDTHQTYHQMKRIHAIHWYQSRFDIYLFSSLGFFFVHFVCVCVYASYYYMVYHIDFECTQIRVCYAISYCIVWIEREKESSLAHNCGVKWSNEKLPYISKTIIIRVSV